MYDTLPPKGRDGEAASRALAGAFSPGAATEGKGASPPKHSLLSTHKSSGFRELGDCVSAEGQSKESSVSQPNACEPNLLGFTFPFESIYLSVTWVLFKLPLDLNNN